jgi:hypothetical protein
MSHGRRGATLTGFVVLALAACANTTPEGPVPDEGLFDAIAALDGVSASDIAYQDDFGNSNMYSGSVAVEPGADARCVLFRVIAILEQGRPGADLGFVSVTGDDVKLGPIDLPAATRRALDDAPTRESATPSVPGCSDVDLGGTALQAPGS